MRRGKEERSSFPSPEIEGVDPLLALFRKEKKYKIKCCSTKYKRDITITTQVAKSFDWIGRK